jgi:hypothetical protein
MNSPPSELRPTSTARCASTYPKVAARTGSSVELAMQTWDTVHRPLLRFVDLSDGFPDDWRVAAVAKRDDEDAAGVGSGWRSDINEGQRPGCFHHDATDAASMSSARH